MSSLPSRVMHIPPVTELACLLGHSSRRLRLVLARAEEKLVQQLKLLEVAGLGRFERTGLSTRQETSIRATLQGLCLNEKVFSAIGAMSSTRTKPYLVNLVIVS